nr:transposase domain-containing protein [Burkholderia ubonensis]
MARTRKALPARVDVAHLISAGVLAAACPRPLIEAILAETGKASQRERRLPAPAVVYYVMALALWREAPLEEVLRVVCEGLQEGRPGFVNFRRNGLKQLIQKRNQCSHQAAGPSAEDPADRTRGG